MVAQDRGQQVGRVAVLGFQGRAVGDADDGLLEVLGPEDRLEGPRAADRDGLPGCAGLPASRRNGCDASSTSGFQSALPANPRTMLAGLYRRSK